MQDSMMDPLAMKIEQHHGAHQEEEYRSAQWVEIAGDHSSHNSPLQEYNGFGFMSPTTHVSLEPMYNRPLQPTYLTPQHLQPLAMLQWPSQLTNPSVDTAPPPPAVPIHRALAPIATTTTSRPSALRAASSPSQAPAATQSTARRTLTDLDRRRMCQYHEDNPTIKQTEIGAMFGVERSTVSKVLRQKEKYLYPEDGSRSPIKRSKGKFPDIERALSNWAKNHQRQCLPLNDDIIRDKARFFATTVGSSDCHVKVNSPVWLEKFKQKNSLLGAEPSKVPDASESDGSFNPGSKSESQTPNGLSPISPDGLPSVSPNQGPDDMKTDSPVSYRHNYSQSATALGSSYTDSTAFSGDLRSPTSPYFSPVSSSRPSPRISAQQTRLPTLASASSRPRRQTFPVVGSEPSYITSPGSSEPTSENFLQQSMETPALGSPRDEMDESPLGIDSAMHQHSQHGTTNNTLLLNISPTSMAPPRNPSSGSSASPRLGSTSGVSSPLGPPSQDEARRALEVLMNFFQHQPSGAVDPEEYFTMGKLMEKLKLQGNVLPGGLHKLEREDGTSVPINRKRSIHSL